MAPKPTVIEATSIEGRWCVKYSDSLLGCYSSYKSPVDAMMAYCARYMGDTMPKTIGERMGIIEQQLTRSRCGRLVKFNEGWILWAHEYSGAPLESLRIITNTRSHKP